MRRAFATLSLLVACNSKSGDTGGETAAPAPFLVTTMTHMEGGHLDDRDEAEFAAHVAQIRSGVTLANAHDAVLTIESERPFARAQINSGMNVLQEVLDRGHGVGSHCDVGWTNTPADVAAFTEELREVKDLVDTLVGPENNRGCSGAGSALDWGQALIGAGFVYVDGVVGMHYAAMPEDIRPDGFSDADLADDAFHAPAPADLDSRMHPFWVRDAQDFTPDSGGPLLISSGELGAIDTYADDGQCAPCDLEMDDVDAALALVDEALAAHDRTRVGKVTLNLPVKYLGSPHTEQLEALYEGIHDRVAAGELQWATQGDAYDAVLSWNPDE